MRLLISDKMVNYMVNYGKKSGDNAALNHQMVNYGRNDLVAKYWHELPIVCNFDALSAWVIYENAAKQIIVQSITSRTAFDGSNRFP